MSEIKPRGPISISSERDILALFFFIHAAAVGRTDGPRGVGREMENAYKQADFILAVREFELFDVPMDEWGD